MEVLEQYFLSRGLFSNQSGRSTKLMNLATGFIAPPTTNIDKTREIGLKILDQMYSASNFKSYTIQKKLLAIQIPPSNMTRATSTESVTVARNADPQLFLQRLLSVLEDGNYKSMTLDDTLRSYELSSVAPSLFDDNGFMRGGSKADLAKAMITDKSYIPTENGKEILVDSNVEVIFDGGALLNRLKWPRRCKMSKVIQSYVTNINDLVGKNVTKVTVVFDGYLESSTKDHVHKKRYPVASMEMVLSMDSELQCDKGIFLSNPKNKQKFIDVLSEHLRVEGISIEKSQKDADLLIVQCALDKAMEKNAIIIGDDTDILVLALHYISKLNPPNNVYMFRQISNTYVDLKSVLSTISKPVMDQILSIHALSGCDTVSQLFGAGKDKLFKQMCKNPENLSDIMAFSQSPYEEKSVKDGGLKIIARLYNMKIAAYEDLRPM